MFEEALSSGLGCDRASPRTFSFPVAVGLHGLAIAAVIGASMWATEEPPDPEVPIVFHLPAVPAGAAGAPRGGARKVPRRPVTRSVHLAAPRELPIHVPTATEDPDVSADADLPGETPEDGGGDGRQGVVPGGIGETDEPVIDLSGAQPPPGGDFRGPDLIRRVEPDYPEVARRARLEGIVVVEAVIASSGDIEEVRVVKSAGALLDSAAEEAVRRWKYRAATLNGRAVRVRLSVKVMFRLH